MFYLNRQMRFFFYIERAALSSLVLEVGSLLADTKGGFIFVRATKVSMWVTGELQTCVSFQGIAGV